MQPRGHHRRLVHQISHRLQYSFEVVLLQYPPQNTSSTAIELIEICHIHSYKLWRSSAFHPVDACQTQTESICKSQQARMQFPCQPMTEVAVRCVLATMLHHCFNITSRLDGTKEQRSALFGSAKQPKQTQHATPNRQIAHTTQFYNSRLGGFLLCCEGVAYLGLAAHEQVEGRVEVLAAVLRQRIHVQLVLCSVQRAGDGTPQTHWGFPLIATHPPREVIHEAALCAPMAHSQVMYPNNPPSILRFDCHCLQGLIETKATLHTSRGIEYELWHLQMSGMELDLAEYAGGLRLVKLECVSKMTTALSLHY